MYKTAQVSRLGNRSSNQDRFTVIETENAVLMVLADGMGGHARGELAAQILVDTFARRFRACPGGRVPEPPEFLIQTVLDAHANVVEAGHRHVPPIEPHTTCVACLVQDATAWWAHAGDSRLYFLRGGHVLFQTRDHTYVEQLYQQGLISEAERATHPLRNYVTQSVGGAAPPATTLAPTCAVRRDDMILLCSDGLWAPLGTDTLSALLCERPLDEALDELAHRAELASYPYSDNISAVALRVLSDPEPAQGGEPQPETPPDHPEPPDALSAAIQEITRAIEIFEQEMKKD
ncbi:MAG: serine/threonine-protein phosphatase [Gammaproteobacteria bacterium]|nr:serine/threonine-protein phosphatase [Gammaproteobacteria bacterium]